ATPPTIQDFDVALDAFAGNTRALVTLHDLFLTISVNARVFGIPTPCTMEVTADSIAIDGRYTLRTDPPQPDGHHHRRRPRLHRRRVLDPGDRADRQRRAARRPDADADQPDRQARR